MGPPITVRSITLHPSAVTPKYWFGGLAFETHFFNALSTTFPEGERFFIQSVRINADGITDSDLLQQIHSFAGQEGQHSLEHAAHVELLIDQGYGALRRMNTLMRNVMRWFTRHQPRYSLAITAAVEHLTAVLADGLMQHPGRWLSPMSTDMRLLWHWHAVEESEHKAVAFDVYHATGGGKTMLRLAMCNALPGLLIEVWIRSCYFLAKDGLLFSGREWRRGIRFLWGREGILRHLVRAHIVFYRSGFHPWQNDNAAQIQAFLQHHHELLTDH
jgi:predicted metal-dependent hydrolase